MKHIKRKTRKSKKNNNLDGNDIEELSKFFDLLQKFDIQDKKEGIEKKLKISK